MRYLLYLVLILVVVALVAGGIFLLLGGDGATSDAATTVTEPEEINAIAVAFVQPPYVDDYDLLRLAGYLDNTSDKAITLANLEFQLSDEDGNKRELIAYQVLDIPPHSRKTFDANAGSLSPDRQVSVSIVELRVSE